jgi:hypothetical protein
MRRPVPEAINAPFARGPDHERHCQHPGCLELGAYRAPVARDRLNEYYWFCLEHVRAYNLAWDYFAGMSEAEIEHQRRWDTVWQPSAPGAGPVTGSTMASGSIPRTPQATPGRAPRARNKWRSRCSTLRNR